MKTVSPGALSAYHELVAGGSPLAEKLPAEGTRMLELPLRLTTTGNGSRGNTRLAAILATKRIRQERRVVADAWLFARWPKGVRPVQVTLTRLAPRKLDAANLGSAFKAVIDQVAVELGINDREFVLDEEDTGIRLRLRQEQSRRHAVRLEVTW